MVAFVFRLLIFFTSFKLRSDWVFLPFLGVNFCKYDKSSYECRELSLHPKHKPSSSTSWKVTDFTLLFVLNILTQIPSDVFSFSSSHSCKSFLVSKDITFRFSCDPFNFIIFYSPSMRSFPDCVLPWCSSQFITAVISLENRHPIKNISQAECGLQYRQITKHAPYLDSRRIQTMGFSALIFGGNHE